MPDPEDAEGTAEGEAPAGAEQQPTKEAPKFVTADELERRLAAAQTDTLARSKKQSSALIQNQLENYRKTVAIAEKSGHPIAQEAQKAAEQEILKQSLVEGADDAPKATPLSPEAWTEYVLGQVQVTFDAVGVEVEPGDPEWKDFEKALKASMPLAQLLNVTNVQAQAKKARIASDKETADARVGAGGGAGAPKGKLSPEQKISAGLRQGDWNTEAPPKKS